MCGIIGYTGDRDTEKVLIEGLKKLEYRGYDSAGIALSGEEEISIYKNEGKVQLLEDRVKEANVAPSFAGIGHTRWATHGKPSQLNSHPHRGKKVVIVHNGIIENYQELKGELAQKGIRPISDTDTEIAALLLDQLYEGDPHAAIFAAIKRLEGSYALGILFTDRPHTIYAVRKDSPLIIGKGQGENFIASDIPAILEYTHDYFLLEEGEMAEITKDNINFYDEKKRPLEKEMLTADWDEQSAMKGGFPHFMVKEINEQPQVVRATLGQYARGGNLFPNQESVFDIKGSIYIVACGSAYHAGLSGKQIIEKMARIPVQVEIASEFRYNNPILRKEDLVVIISQSGETADSLAALRLAKAQGVPTLGIVNVRGSTIAREAATVFYTAAGPEISVATTKAYLCQVALLNLMALKMAEKYISPEELQEKLQQLFSLPTLIKEVLKKESQIKAIAAKFKDAEHLFFIGRGQDYALSCESSLKLKEISYVHSEAYAAGELKHGTISLIEPGTPVVAVMTDRSRIAKTAGNIKEVHARGAIVLCLTHPDVDCSDFADELITLPECSDFIAPIVGAIATQLFAYHIAVARGNDVDKPRNLAKSVTVE
ncbi:MAG: glutamine--fructose-6-phosphate transaminase (isomerizing) [Clostridia bacterium]|nr:glutamine--fructose-6-phosphate transaminase (isomerizing) [Clostridia bacterium]